jgi:hypothetical protein
MSLNPFNATRAIAENQIRRMIEEGKFDNLPGAGKPIPDIDEPYDENWWLKSFLKREGITGRELMEVRQLLKKQQ